MIPIVITLLSKVIAHGDDVHKLQQPLPSLALHNTSVISLRLVIGLSSIDDVDVDDDDDDVDGDNWLILAASFDVVNDDVVCI